MALLAESRVKQDLNGNPIIPVRVENIWSKVLLTLRGYNKTVKAT